MICCYIVFREKDKEKIIRICESVSQKDNTFNYKISAFKDKSKGDYLLKIFSHKQTKDQAHKRGLYFVKKNKVGEFYWVK